MDPLLAEKHAQDPKVYEEVMGFADYLGFDLAAFPELYWIAEQVRAPPDPRRSSPNAPTFLLPPSPLSLCAQVGVEARAGLAEQAGAVQRRHGPRCLSGRQPADGGTPPPIYCFSLTSPAGVPRGGQARNAPLPEPWTEHTDDGGNTYYFNEQLQEVSRSVRPLNCQKRPAQLTTSPWSVPRCGAVVLGAPARRLLQGPLRAAQGRAQGLAGGAPPAGCVALEFGSFFLIIFVCAPVGVCACPASMAPLRARPSVCEISLSADGCVHQPNDTPPPLSSARPGAPPRPAMRYGGSASTSSLLLHAGSGGRGGSGDQVRVSFFMIRTADAMDRIVGESQPRIRFLS
eukprot:COSAG01_NODE_4327_length_5128_cov_23.227833_6_plen_344_part_00